jgi:carboxylesterase
MNNNLPNPNLHNSHLDGAPILSLSGKTGVLLLHGFTATPYEVRALAQYFIDRGLSVAAPALAGHATNPEDMLTVHWKDWLKTGEDGYLQLVDHCDRIFVGGESTGAVVSLFLAALNPEIAGILAFSPAMRLPLGIIDTFAIKFLSGMIKYSPKNDLDGNTTWQGYRVNPLNGVKQLIALEDETINRLKNITQPVLVFIGGKDKTIDLVSGDIVINNISSQEKNKVFYPSAEHCILLGDEFDEAANLAWQFIQEHSAEQR